MGDLAMNAVLDVFRGKKVFITGDTGFKGSWLASWLNILGAKVYGYALPPATLSDHFSVLQLDGTIHHTDGDIRNFSQVAESLNNVSPDFVFHLAAQPLVRKSYADPRTTFDTNITGTINVLEAVRVTPEVKVMVLITSDKCYKNREWCWGYRENDELGGKDPYSASKAAAEMVFAGYHESFFRDREDFGAASVRAGNVIGGGDWSEDRIVPDCVRSLRDNKPIQLRNPGATRPWQHVLEPLSGYLLLAARLWEDPKRYEGSYNFGPSGTEMHTVKDLAEVLISSWGSGEIEITKKDTDPHEAGLLHLNCDKAYHTLGWRPKWDFERTVSQTAVWYKQFLSGEPAKSLTLQQIADYMETKL